MAEFRTHILLPFCRSSPDPAPEPLRRSLALRPSSDRRRSPSQGPDRVECSQSPLLHAHDCPAVPQARARLPHACPRARALPWVNRPSCHRKLVVMIPTHIMAAIMILTSEKILDIHNLVISNFGGLDGVLCQGTIDYLVDQINAEPDLFRKAALALHIVANCHPFLDGNKRSAFQIAELILSSKWRAITAKDNNPNAAENRQLPMPGR